MFLSPATSYEVESYNKKSIGPYGISEHLLKILKAHIAPLLSCLINESFLCGIFPEKLKFVKLISFLKKGFTQDKDSYRPISVLLSSVKYLRRSCITERLYAYLEHQNMNSFPLLTKFVPLSINNSL